jgi:hypothetical protein
MEDKLEAVSKLIAKSKTKGLTLSEVNQVKRMMDDSLSIFTIAGTPKAGQATK